MCILLTTKLHYLMFKMDLILLRIHYFVLISLLIGSYEKLYNSR